jgi:hypothetical protein
MESLNNGIIEDLSAMSDDISQGLLYTHTRINDNTKKILESISFLDGMIELLINGERMDIMGFGYRLYPSDRYVRCWWKRYR